MLTGYVPIAILGAVVVALGAIVLTLSFVVGPRAATPSKLAPYESGLTPIGPGRRRVPVRFYLVATLFILFDVEIIYLFPWAVQFRELARPVPEGIGAASLGVMAVFLGVLLVGLIHVWRNGALEWR